MKLNGIILCVEMYIVSCNGNADMHIFIKFYLHEPFKSILKYIEVGTFNVKLLLQNFSFSYSSYNFVLSIVCFACIVYIILRCD